MSEIKHKFGKLFLIDPKSPFFSEKSRKVFLIASFSYVGITTLLLFAIQGLLDENYFYSAILVGFSALTTLFIISFSYRTDLYNQASYALVLIMFMLCMAVLFLFEAPSNGLIWQYVLVPMMFFLVGNKSGIFLGILLFVITLIFYLFLPQGELIEYALFFRYCISYWILLFFIFLYEFVRKRTHSSLLGAKGKISELLAETMQQNEEIKTQNEEIRAQSEQLEKANNELDKLSLAAKHTDNAVVIISPEGAFEWVNEGFEKLMGYKISDIPVNKRNIKHITSVDNIEEILSSCKLEKKSISYESVHEKPDNTTTFLNSTITPVFDENGNLSRYIVVDSDISLIIKAHNKLEELNKTLESRIEEELRKNREKDVLLMQQSRQAAMGEMISNIAHQWRQPLNAIGIIVQNLSEAYEYGEIDDKYLTEKINKVMSLISYMSETIDDFRNFFKPEKKAQKFFVKEAVTKAISFVEANFNGLNIEILFSSKNSPVAYGYPNEYMQVVINILNNAKDALLENNVDNPLVKINVSDNDKGSVLRVYNSGGHISNEISDKIFDPYFSTKHITRGTGLGLYMGKSIIENNMNGKLYFENKKDGVEFIVELPDSSKYD